MLALLIVILLALAVWFGTDSRDGQDWSPRTS
jgi:hypothetical protein